MELEYTSTDLSRIMWHIENSQKTMKEAIYKARYEKLVSDLNSVGLHFNDISSEELMARHNGIDERLKWKTQLMVEEKFKEDEEEPHQ